MSKPFNKLIDHSIRFHIRKCSSLNLAFVLWHLSTGKIWLWAVFGLRVVHVRARRKVKVVGKSTEWTAGATEVKAIEMRLAWISISNRNFLWLSNSVFGAWFSEGNLRKKWRISWKRQKCQKIINHFRKLVLSGEGN